MTLAELQLVLEQVEATAAVGGVDIPGRYLRGHGARCAACGVEFYSELDFHVDDVHTPDCRYLAAVAILKREIASA